MLDLDSFVGRLACNHLAREIHARVCQRGGVLRIADGESLRWCATQAHDTGNSVSGVERQVSAYLVRHVFDSVVGPASGYVTVGIHESRDDPSTGKVDERCSCGNVFGDGFYFAKLEKRDVAVQDTAITH